MRSGSNAFLPLAGGRGQGARPRPVDDAGSVSWRSGQNCAKWTTSKQFWAPQEDLTLLYVINKSFKRGCNKLIRSGGRSGLVWFINKVSGPSTVRYAPVRTAEVTCSFWVSGLGQFAYLTCGTDGSVPYGGDIVLPYWRIAVRELLLCPADAICFARYILLKIKCDMFHFVQRDMI